MKTNNLLFSLVAFIALSACAGRLESQEFNGRQVTIHAYHALPYLTKTTVQDGGAQVFWEKSEEIGVFYKGACSRFVSQNTELAAVADFVGSMDILVGANEGSALSNYLWGLYPYSETATSDGESVTSTLPAEQVGRAGSFAKNTHITLARSSSHDLAFYNVCGGVRFSLVREGVKSVSIKGNKGEPLAGVISIIFDEGAPVIRKVSEPQDVVTLVAPDGGTFETGAWYYIELLPGTLEEGFTMDFKGDGFGGEMSTSASVTIKRGVFGNLSNVDAKTKYEKYTTINYRTYNKAAANLYTGSEWYQDIVSNTYDSDSNLGIVSFAKEVNTFYRLFSDPSVVTYLEIPESITSIADKAFSYLGYYHGGVELVSLATTAPVIGSYCFKDANIASFSYPDDADYLGWYYPNIRFNAENSDWVMKENGLYNHLGLCPQVVWVSRNSEYTAPTIVSEWEGKYLGCACITDGDDDEYIFAFDRKITRIPEKAFYYWHGDHYSRFKLSDIVTEIGDRAFEGAYLSSLPRMRGVSVIGKYAFAVDRDQSYTYNTIDLPVSVESISDYAFQNSKAKIICTYGKRPYVSSNAFYSIVEGGTVFYPKGQASLYNSSTMRNWSNISRDASIVPQSMSAGLYVYTTSSPVSIEFSIGDGYQVDTGMIMFDGTIVYDLGSNMSVSHKVISIDCTAGEYIMVSVSGNSTADIHSVEGADVIGECTGSNGNETFSFDYSGDKSKLQFIYHYYPQYYNNDFIWTK